MEIKNKRCGKKKLEEGKQERRHREKLEEITHGIVVHCRTDGSKMCTMKIGILSFLCLFALTLFSIAVSLARSLSLPLSLCARSLQFGFWLLVPPLLFIYIERWTWLCYFDRMHGPILFLVIVFFLHALAYSCYYCCCCFCCILFFIFTQNYFLYDT